MSQTFPQSSPQRFRVDHTVTSGEASGNAFSQVVTWTWPFSNTVYLVSLACQVVSASGSVTATVAGFTIDTVNQITVNVTLASATENDVIGIHVLGWASE